MKINQRIIDIDEPMYIIAELSANHGQDLDVALEMIQAAAACGADAVKLQTYTPDTITLDVADGPFLIEEGSLWAGRSLHDLYQDAYTPWDWFPTLADAAAKAGVDIFSSPFDLTAVAFLESQDVPAFKIASFELVDHGLIRAVANTGKPMIMSTGMATLAEIAEAVQVARAAGCSDLALLRCNSGYPTPLTEMDLRTIPSMISTFDCPIGLSDHTDGIEAAIVGRTLGACIIEKHFVLERASGALDAEFSLEPDEFSAMVTGIRRTEEMLGEVRYGPTAREKHSHVHRRSLFVAEDVRKGETFTEVNVRSVRPGQGLAPKFLPIVLGSTATRDLKKGTPVSWEALSGEPTTS